MKTAEILRNILDLLDAEEKETAQQPVVININNGEVTDSQAQEEPVDADLGVMVPPLQQKIELMKKSAGVESVYDEEPEEEDELAILKRQAGLNTAVIADEDEPLEG